MGFLRRILSALGRLVRGQRVLCDTCKYDYGNVCKRPERPNATSCPDYRRR